MIDDAKGKELLRGVLSPAFVDEIERFLDEKARSYEDLYFRYLAVCRDYPYAQHYPPHVGEIPFGAREIARRCQLEFRRSNPGFEL